MTTNVKGVQHWGDYLAQDQKNEKRNIKKRFPGPLKDTKRLKEPAKIREYFLMIKLMYSGNQDASLTNFIELSALIGFYHAKSNKCRRPMEYRWIRCGNVSLYNVFSEI